jgi:RimK family alpha-L-glutamate ligase
LPFINSCVYGLNEKAAVELRDKYPKIIKHNLSSRGKEVFKVKSGRGLTRIFNQEYFARTMLVQPFLMAGEDLRIIVLGGNAIGAMKRIARKGKYLTNYSQGGMVENYDLNSDSDAKDIAERTAKHFLLDYVGVDLMKGEDGNWKVLEVNRACQFQGFEKATGINVPEKVIKYLLLRKEGR